MTYPSITDYESDIRRFSEAGNNFLDVSTDIVERVAPIFYGDPKAGAFISLGCDLATTHSKCYLVYRALPGSIAFGTDHIIEIKRGRDPSWRTPTCNLVVKALLRLTR